MLSLETSSTTQQTRAFVLFSFTIIVIHRRSTFYNYYVNNCRRFVTRCVSSESFTGERACAPAGLKRTDDDKWTKNENTFGNARENNLVTSFFPEPVW